MAAMMSVHAGSKGEIRCLQEEVTELKAQYKWLPAIAACERLLCLSATELGEGSPETISAMQQLGWLVNCNSEHVRAEGLYRRALEIQEAASGKDSPELAGSLRMLSNIRGFAGDPAGQLKLLERAYTLLRDAPERDAFEFGKVQAALGYDIWCSSGDLKKAQEILAGAIISFKSVGGPAEEDLARVLSHLGIMLEESGQFEAAEVMLRRVLGWREQALGPDHADTGEAMKSLADLYRVQGNWAKAEPLYLASLDIQQKAFDASEQFKLFDTLATLGGFYLRKGELTKAEGFLERALHVGAGEWMATRMVGLADALTDLGRIYATRGQHQQARELFQRAYCTFVESTNFRAATGGAFLRQYACGQFALGNPEGALAVANQVQDSEEEKLVEFLSMVSERQRLEAMKNFSPTHRFQPWASLGAPGPLARAILRTKGIVLDSLLEDRLLAQANGNAATGPLLTRLAKIREQYAELKFSDDHSSTPLTEERTHALKAMTQERESVEAALARSLGWFGQARRVLTVREEDVQAAIPAGAALLEFISYSDLPEMRLPSGSQANPLPAKYGVLVLGKSAEPKWVQLGPAAEIDKNIQLLHHLVRNPGESELLLSVLRDLYDRVWRPVQVAVPVGTDRFIVSPDRELDFLSFASLLLPNGSFLGETIEITYVSSGRDLLANTRPALSSNLIVWANPDFGAAETPGAGVAARAVTSRAASVRAFRDVSFSPLPGAENEGEMLRARGPGLGLSEVVVHLGKNATKLELSHVESPYILHLATHGFILPETQPGPSHVADGSVGPPRDEPDSASNPMLRSGVALAGAQRTLEAWARGETVPPENDGIVTAEEIALLNLRNTWLVVLSACDTGIGPQQSAEGVLGLRRAFVEAGAQNLLMTLWPIDDEQTVRLIGDFYQAALRLKDAPEALCQVQGKWLARLRRERGAAEACRIAGPFIMSFRGSAPNARRTDPSILNSGHSTQTARAQHGP